MEIPLSTVKYSGLVFPSLIFQRKAKNINFDGGGKVKLEIQKLLKRPDVIVWKEAVNFLANIHECKLTI